MQKGRISAGSFYGREGDPGRGFLISEQRGAVRVSGGELMEVPFLDIEINYPFTEYSERTFSLAALFSLW